VQNTTIEKPVLSIVIVNFQVPDLVVQAIRSIKEASLSDKSEIIIVDNASDDNSYETITTVYPDVIWVPLKTNIGFGKGNNVGVKYAQGEYILFLNPDTIISDDTLQNSISYMQEHDDIGILGPKILNPNGTFQASCRRSFPTPFNAFSYMFGLSSLFPKSKLFGQYNLTYADPDEPMAVDAISGSCMFIKKDLFDHIGGFDKNFFMYGEDLDLCARVKEAGYKVWYHPLTKIIHFKGKSSIQKAMKTRFAFYEAMIIFSRKYRKHNHVFLPLWLVYIGIFFQATMNAAKMLHKVTFAILMDTLSINVVLSLSLIGRFIFTEFGFPYNESANIRVILMHTLLTFSFLGVYLFRGIYSRQRYSKMNALISGYFASTIFLASLAMIRFFAFSRISFAVSAILIPPLLISWRMLLPRVLRWVQKAMYATGSVIIIGNNTITKILIKNIESDKTAHIKGIVWPLKNGHIPGDFFGYPILGRLENIEKIIKENRAQLLLIATKEAWYSYIISTLSHNHSKITIRWVPTECFQLPEDQLPDTIPLQDLNF